MKRTASAIKTLKSNGSSTKKSAARKPPPASPKLRYVVCVKGDVNIDLEVLKVYRVRADETAASRGLIRVIDESGEDYLYPKVYFRLVQASSNLFEIVEQGA